MKQALLGILLGFALILGLNTCIAHAATPTPPPAVQAAIDTAMKKLHQFPTLNEAAIYAIQRAYKCSHYYECGGLIATSLDGKIFYVGTVRTDFSGDSVELGKSAPPGYKLVADFHTHPCLGKSHYVSSFSPQDISLIVEHGTIGIVGDLCTGDVHLYDPHTMAPDTVLLEEDAPSTPGITIGKIAVDGVNLEPDTGN